MSNKIVVIGSSNTDMVIQSAHLPKPGETVLGGSFSMNPGGKGANQANVAAKLGGDITFIAKVGDDLFGNQAIANFNKVGIDTQFISKDPNNSSGIALINVDDKGENSIAVALGANATLSKEDIDNASDSLEQSKYVLTQLETPIETINYLGEIAERFAFKLVLNPAPAQPLSDDLMRSIDIITPNEIEAELLSGIKVNDNVTAKEAAEIIKDKGVNSVIITMGSKGAFVLSDDLCELIPTTKIDVVDTTAAGDTFNGALVVALAEGKSLKQAIVFANKAAAYSVGILGAQSSAPSLNDIK